MTPNQFKNILVFSILVGSEDPSGLHHSPEYILEKYFRYIDAAPRDDERWRTGPHPAIAQYIHAYFTLWRLDEPGMMSLLCREPAEVL